MQAVYKIKNMFTTQELYEVFKKKISNQEKADRLCISLDEYDYFKKLIYEVIDEEQDNLDRTFVQKLDAKLNNELPSIEISNTEYHEDLEKGTMKVTTLVS